MTYVSAYRYSYELVHVRPSVHTEDVARTMSAGLCVLGAQRSIKAVLIGLPRPLSRSASSRGHASLYGKVLEQQRHH